MFKMQLRGGVWWGSLSKRFGVADREGPGCLALPSISGLVSLIFSPSPQNVASEGLLGPLILVTSFPGEKEAAQDLTLGQMSCSG